MEIWGEGYYSYEGYSYEGGQPPETKGTPIFIGPTPSILDTANPINAGMNTELCAAFASDLGCATDQGTPTLGRLTLAGFLETLGTDSTDLSGNRGLIEQRIATDLTLAVSQVTVNHISMLHPPRPPPSPPPSPWSPPAPPLTPPSYPTNPPYDLWYTRYFENEGCDPDCVGGCRRSRWSNIYTWHGQGLNLGLPEDDAFGWPGWKSNVTIKRCHTVVLDVDINVQLYSIVVWGTLEIENREHAEVSLPSSLHQCQVRQSWSECKRRLW